MSILDYRPEFAPNVRSVQTWTSTDLSAALITISIAHQRRARGIIRNRAYAIFKAFYDEDARGPSPIFYWATKLLQALRSQRLDSEAADFPTVFRRQIGRAES